ncbi:hypothetical protein GCM10028803_46470 [Larkinella knui]
MNGDRQKLLEENIVTVIDSKFKPGVGNLILRIFGGSQIKFFDSQSSLKQITQGSGQIIVASLVAMENSYANLGFCVFKNVFQRIQNVNRAQLERLGRSQISYADVMSLERSLAIDFAGNNLNGLQYRIINSFDEIKDDGLLNIILSIEGGHCFYQRPSVLDQESAANAHEVVDALFDWKQKVKTGQLPRLLYTTLTHHTTNCLTNHSFGVPPGLAGAGKNSVAGGFNPAGNSLTDVGISFIQAALKETDEEKRILIDVKHLSLRARLDFYELRRQMINEGHPSFPILATHMGVTGLSLNDAIVVPETGCRKFPEDDNCFEVEYVDAERLNGFFVTTSFDTRIDILRFNPWTINLFDEDITEIVESDGLIGFSFDSRILGNEVVDRERFSKHEMNPLPSISGIDFDNEIDLENGEVIYPFQNKQEFGESRYPEKPFFDVPFTSGEELKKHTDLMALCQNIVHAVRIGGSKAWDCICIGSDYDGLINSIDFVPNASVIPAMERLFKLYMTSMVTTLNEFIAERHTGEDRIDIPDDFYERFVIENAKVFLKKHFI